VNQAPNETMMASPGGPPGYGPPPGGGDGGGAPPAGGGAGGPPPGGYGPPPGGYGAPPGAGGPPGFNPYAPPTAPSFGGASPYDMTNVTCPEAKHALIYAIVGLLCCGFIFGPIAIVKARSAKAIIAMNPGMKGEGMATAAMVIGIIDIVFAVLGILIRLANIGNN
jgi:hypothetical protein